MKVFEQNGFKMENMGKMSFFSNIIVPYRDLTGGADMNLLANNEGTLLPNKSGMDRGTMIQEQPNGAAYYITDKTGYDSFYRIRKHVGLGYYSEGATLEELAEKLGIDAEGLKASVEQYNARRRRQARRTRRLRLCRSVRWMQRARITACASRRPTT